MKQIAILGTSSQIAKDLILLIAAREIDDLILYVRQPDSMQTWLAHAGLSDRYRLRSYSEYGDDAHDAVINFVGVGDPSRAAAMSGDIFDIYSLNRHAVDWANCQHIPRMTVSGRKLPAFSGCSAAVATRRAVRRLGPI